MGAHAERKPQPLKEALRRSAYEVKTIVARYPVLALPVARRRHGFPVGEGTEIVIEGFPRSGMTFAVTAFRMAQPRPTDIACHVHAPAQIIAATRGGLPALVLVREPEDTILSFVIRHSHIPIRQAIRGWLRFYEPLLPHRDGFVVGRFRDVTSDFGAVIRRLNERFGTGFREFEHTEENVRTCFERIESDYGQRDEDGLALERIVARPSEVRARIKDALREEYRAGALAALRARAEDAYDAFVRAADAPLR